MENKICFEKQSAQLKVWDAPEVVVLVAEETAGKLSDWLQPLVLS